MAVRLGPARWVVLLAAALVGMGALLVVWWPGSGSSVQLRRASATVVTSASCQGGNQYDTVELTIDGQKKRARLDGCGHHEGEVLDVQVPDGAGNGDLLVQAAGAAPAGSGMSQRLSALLVSISALAGAGYAHLLRRRPGTPLFPVASKSRVGTN